MDTRITRHIKNILNDGELDENSTCAENAHMSNKGKLNGILEAVYQNVFGEELYKSLESKAAHLLYFLVKDHPFVDGCKRIAATIFLEFLKLNNALVNNGKFIYLMTL